MTRKGQFRFLIVLVVIALINGFKSKWSAKMGFSLRKRSQGKLMMANAFASPSVITRQKRDEVMNDPFESPSALINGGTGNEKCKLSKV